jgi:hypothetical protein
VECDKVGADKVPDDVGGVDSVSGEVGDVGKAYSKARGVSMSMNGQDRMGTSSRQES